MRAALLAAILVVLAATPLAEAAVTRSCEIVPHGRPAGVSTNGCTLAGLVTQRLDATVTVVAGNVDVIEIDMLAPDGASHAFVCTFTITSATCPIPVQGVGAPGEWRITARAATSDPAGILLGGFDSYARLDATFV